MGFGPLCAANQPFSQHPRQALRQSTVYQYNSSHQPANTGHPAGRVWHSRDIHAGCQFSCCSTFSDKNFPLSAVCSISTDSDNFLYANITRHFPFRDKFLKFRKHKLSTPDLKGNWHHQRCCDLLVTSLLLAPPTGFNVTHFSHK